MFQTIRDFGQERLTESPERQDIGDATPNFLALPMRNSCLRGASKRDGSTC